MSKLKALDIDRLYTKLRKRGLAPATIRQVHAILRASLNQAERWSLVQRNVAKLASAPSRPQREQRPPDVADVLALLAAARDVDTVFGLYVRVMVATGARRAEVCGLRWSDVDQETGTLTVQRSYMRVPGVRGDRPTKPRSARTVALDAVTLNELENAWVATCALAQQCGMNVELRRDRLHLCRRSDRPVAVAPTRRTPVGCEHAMPRVSTRFGCMTCACATRRYVSGWGERTRLRSVAADRLKLGAA